MVLDMLSYLRYTYYTPIQRQNEARGTPMLYVRAIFKPVSILQLQ